MRTQGGSASGRGDRQELPVQSGPKPLFHGSPSQIVEHLNPFPRIQFPLQKNVLQVHGVLNHNLTVNRAHKEGNLECKTTALKKWVSNWCPSI